MLLTTKPHTVGNIKRWTVDYSNWLAEDVVLTTAVVTSSSATCTVSGVSVPTTGKKILFNLNGGVLNETFTVTLSATTSRGEIKNDTLSFYVVAP